MKLTLRPLFFSVLCAVWLVGCGPSGEKKDNSSDFDKAEQSLKEEIKKVVYNIPSPSEIPYLLQATGADFNQKLINDKSKVDQYASRIDKAALNLGVYAADIGYLSSYEKTQEAISYIESAKKLADGLNVVGTFDADLLKQFESNVSNKDSLASLLNRAVQKTDNYLQDDNRNKLAALVLTGSFIEGLYIATELVQSYPKDILPTDARNTILTPIIKVITDQRKSVDELVNMLGNVGDDAEVAALKTQMEKLQASYAALTIDDQIKNNKGSLVLSDKNLVEITNIVEQIRASIIQ
ncbi:MAG: hypothetical protein MUC38_05475 [Cyclobacteriaceae bacterium]|jgi:hypothetical protein|nr:hypothetical protein [Cyclobacteriaceae bacterium]